MVRYGEPDGHGRYGMLDSDGTRLMCHDCGGWYGQLATHARLVHGYADAAQYRAAHGLALTTRLVGAAASAAMSARWDAPDREARLARLAAARDPHAAHRASMLADRPWRPEAVAARQALLRSRRGRALTDEEIAALADQTDIPAWVRAARIVLAGEGVTVGSIARSLDVSAATIYDRLRRYPADGQPRGRWTGSE